MAKRVLTGCGNCKKCNSAKIVRGTRNLTRGIIALSTVGLSEAGMAMAGTCGACGHQMSLHKMTWMQRLQAEADAVQERVLAEERIKEEARAKVQAEAEARKELEAEEESTPPAKKSGPPEGFYTDPDGKPVLRWWDGAEWTDFTKPLSVDS